MARGATLVRPHVFAEAPNVCLECGHKAVHTKRRGCTQIVARPVTGYLCRCDGRITRLSDLERAALEGIQDGLSHEEIARTMNYSTSNVNMALSRLREKWGVRSNTGLIAVLLRVGIL